MQFLEIPDEVIKKIAVREQQELERRERLYRGERTAFSIHSRTVILVDDGIATGATMHAAIAALKQRQPARIIIAVPAAAPSTCKEFAEEVDGLVCVIKPEPFIAVGYWYQHFSQTSDEEVRCLLERANHTLSTIPRRYTNSRASYENRRRNATTFTRQYNITCRANTMSTNHLEHVVQIPIDSTCLEGSLALPRQQAQGLQRYLMSNDARPTPLKMW